MKQTGSWSERLERLGAAARRGVEIAELKLRFADLLGSAGERVDIGSVFLSMEELGLEELEGGLSGIGEGGRGSLELLEHRERLEAVATAGRLLNLDCVPLERRLAAIDQIGEARVAAFLHLNEARRAAQAELQPEARRCWWWGARIDCDREALAALGIGADAEQELRRHVEQCVHCQRELSWLSRLDALLGPGAEADHPTTAELLAHAAGEGEASRRQAVAEHLEACPACRGLLAGARSGLAEAERVEAGLALERGLGAGRSETEQGDQPPVHLLLPVAVPAQPRALAADPAEEPSPLPSGRRALIEQGELRLVFYEVAGRGQVGLFGEEQDQADLAVHLDGELLAPTEREPEARVFDLGPLASLAGRTLSVKLGDVERSWTMIEDRA